MQELKNLTDEQLVKLAQEGNVDAEEAILIKYKDVVRSKGGIYYIAGGDGNDIAQEGMIGLVKAIRGYDPSQGASFSTYAQLCITRQIVSAVRSASREKHSPLNNAISLDDPFIREDGGESTLGDTIPAGSESDPELTAINTEILKVVLQPKNASFSKLEHVVIRYMVAGKSCREIADLTGKTPKQINNAVQRVREKIKKSID